MSAREKPRCASMSKPKSSSAAAGMPSTSVQNSIAQRPLVEGELDVEGVAEALLDRLQGLFGEALRHQRRMVDAGRGLQRAVADGVTLHLADLLRRIAELGEGFRNDPVDDLEVAAAGQLLELHQGEVRLDAGGVAVHHQTDGAGRGDHRGLRIAEAVQLAKLQGVVPGAAGGGDQFLVGALVGLDARPAGPTGPRSSRSCRGRRGDGCG